MSGFYGYGMRVMSDPQDIEMIDTPSVHIVRIDVHRRTTRAVRFYMSSDRANKLVDRYNRLYRKRGFYIVTI